MLSLRQIAKALGGEIVCRFRCTRQAQGTAPPIDRCVSPPARARRLACLCIASHKTMTSPVATTYARASVSNPGSRTATRARRSDRSRPPPPTNFVTLRRANPLPQNAPRFRRRNQVVLF